MVSPLRKIFIKDYNNTSDPKVREKHGLLASFVGIFTNLLLFGFKLLIGILTLSLAIITDAINNLTDMASCVVNLVGFKLANKPADKEHPFGHERIEYIAGMIISFIIICIAVVLGYESINKVIANEGAYPNVITFVILGAAIIVKMWQGLFYNGIAKVINSVSLKASSQDSFNDCISTGVILIASIVQYILEANGVIISFSIDGILGIGLSIFIIITGIKLIIDTANPLIGLTPDHDLVKAIVDDIESYEGVLGIHDLMCHNYGPTKLFMTIHVEVDSKVDVMVSHDLIDNIENEVGNKYNIMLTIHMDPIDNSSDQVKELKEQAKKILIAYNEHLNLHDFRIVSGETHTNIIFDVLIPYDAKIKESELDKYLRNEFSKLDSKYNLVVKYDNDFVG